MRDAWPDLQLPDPPNPADIEDDLGRLIAAQEAAEDLADRSEDED